MSPAEPHENAPQHDADARTPQLMPAGTGNVDKIRDILFGTQMRDYETRFARLEETVAKETAEMRETNRRRFDQLEQYIKREFEALESRVKAERDERSDAGSRHSRDLNDLGETLTRRIREVDDRGLSVEKDLRGHVLQQSKELSDQMQQRHDEIFNLLEKRFQELRHDKTDRAALSSLFTEVALRLNDQFQYQVRIRKMPEPPADPTATGNPANGAGAAEFAELRRALIGPEQDQIDGLRKRLDDPAVRSTETGKILPAAIRNASRRNLGEALEPVFEKSFRSSVRKNPREISDAIYPLMGPAIRRSIAVAIREFAQSLNQMVEKSASWRAIRWRIEARVTGRPFAEILLTRSLLYSVEQVFLIHRASGVLLMHVAAKSVVVRDADMVSGMFTAIQDFVSDSFLESGQELETIEVGHYKLWIQYGSKALLVGAVSGTAPVELNAVFRSALEKIHEALLPELDTFKQGDLSVFEPARPILESCLLGQRAPDKRSRWMLWLVVAAVVVLLAGLMFVEVRNVRRWDAYVDALRHAPGIVVLRAEQHGAGGLVAGLKDPKAPEPSGQLADFGIDAAKVRYEFQPYLSLDTPFAAARELEADLERIRALTIRFELASPELPVAESGLIEDLAAAIKRVRKARLETRVTITGHTDEVGDAETNSKLSVDRAVTVRQALAAQGIPDRVFIVRGVGNSQPVRTGGTKWDQAANRCVSFQVDQ